MTPLFSRGWMSRALVAFSVALVSLAFASIAIAQATYEGREERSLNRAPVLAGTSDEARLAFAERTPILPGGPVTVVYFDPNGSIEPPPGLVGWPAPGSVAVSPAMSSDGVVVSEVFGEISAQIQPEGLASPNERLIYVVPNDAIPRSSGWQQASGIGLSENLGDDDLWTFGEIFEVAPIESLVLTLLVFLVLPSLWLLITTTGLNARADSDRAVVLEVLGMSPLRIARVRFRALLPALLLGNLVSVLIVIAVGSWGWRVWGIDWRIYGPDLSSHVGVICGALLVGALLGALIILVRCWPPRPRGGTVVSPSPPRQEFRRVALAFLVLLVLSVLLYAGAVTGSEWSAFGTSVLALGSAASASLICGYLLWRLGAPLRCWGARRGSPAAIVAAGEMHSGARDPVRLAAGGVIAMLLLSILTLLVVGNAQVTREVRVAVSAFAGSMAEVGVPQRPGANLEYAISLGALPPDAETVLLQRDYSDGEGNEVRVKTSPTMAQALGLSPGPQSIVELPRVLQEYVEVYAGVGAHAVVEISEDAPMLQEDSGAPQSTVLLVGYPDGRPVDVYELQSAMNSVLAPGWNVRTPFEAWARGAEYARQNGIWVTWAGAIGVSLAIASLWLQSWQHVAAASAAFARLGAFGGGARVVWLLTGARTAIPVIIGVGVGGALSTVVGVPLLAALGLNLAVLVAPIALTAALLVAAGLVAWILASSKAWRVMLTWRPGHSAVGID